MKGILSGFVIILFTTNVNATVIGTPTNDLLFFEGTDRIVNETILLPNGETYTLNGNYSVSNTDYDGLDGFDTIFMSSINDYLTGIDVANVERIIAGNGSDYIDLRGMPVNQDPIQASASFQTLVGAGADLAIGISNQRNIIKGANGDDVVFGGSLSDELEGNSDNDSVYGLGGEDHINGGPGNDRLFGGEENDIIIGGQGNDHIEGGSGDDTIVLGNGLDTVKGGSGKDVFNYDVGDTLIDTILDFEIGDLFNVTATLSGFSVGDDFRDFITFDYHGDGAFISIDSDGAGSNSDFHNIAFLAGVTGGLAFSDMTPIAYDDPNSVLLSTQNNLLAGGIFIQPQGPTASVPAPASFGIFILGLVIMTVRRKTNKNIR